MPCARSQSGEVGVGDSAIQHVIDRSVDDGDNDSTWMANHHSKPTYALLPLLLLLSLSLSLSPFYIFLYI